jgi:hypothetical protein
MLLQEIRISQVSKMILHLLLVNFLVSIMHVLAISNFKLVKVMPVGMMVTLRGERMYAFLEKLIAIVLPRVRDFRGVSGRGIWSRKETSTSVSRNIPSSQKFHNSMS